MGFIFDKINLKKENSVDIHDEFVKPFIEAEVMDSYINYHSLKDNPWDKVLYEKSFSDGIVYRIYGNDYVLEQGIGKFGFELEDKKHKRKLAELIFSINNSTTNKFFNLGHRVIDSKHIGISGTDFLKKAEEYLRILKNHNELLSNKIKCEVSQPKVLKWFEKNKFTFSEDNTQNPEDFFKVEGQGLSPVNNYRFIKVLDSENNILKDEYLINQDFILDKDFQSKWKDSLDMKNFKNSKDPEVIIDLGRDNMGAGNIIEELIEKKYIPRFNLEKDI
ncbi:MAG: hypothetical protein QG644_205 [Patescibacteria group bacterium]|nr:hypothetical protein [Patescibacteria group bacterium]